MGRSWCGELSLHACSLCLALHPCAPSSPTHRAGWRRTRNLSLGSISETSLARPFSPNQISAVPFLPYSFLWFPLTWFDSSWLWLGFSFQHMRHATFHPIQSQTLCEIFREERMREEEGGGRQGRTGTGRTSQLKTSKLKTETSQHFCFGGLDGWEWRLPPPHFAHGLIIV